MLLDDLAAVTVDLFNKLIKYARNMCDVAMHDRSITNMDFVRMAENHNLSSER